MNMFSDTDSMKESAILRNLELKNERIKKQERSGKAKAALQLFLTSKKSKRNSKLNRIFHATNI